MNHEESTLIRKGPCDECGSSDANALYSDGHSHCFSCGHFERGDGETQHYTGRKKVAANLDEYRDADADGGLPARQISAETCRKFGVRVGKLNSGSVVHMYPYYKDGQVVAFKARGKDKEFKFVGETKHPQMFGQQLWSGGKKLVVTEGEIDALTVSQLQGNKWPVVSVPNGAQGAKRDIARQMDFFQQFEEIILMFDQDEPGQAAAKEVAEMFEPGVAKIASLPHKDPNDCLKAGAGEEVIKAIWNAKPYRPDGIVSISEVAEEAEREIPDGAPWWLDSLTKLTYGRREGECYAFGAGTGIGKTDWFTQGIAYDLLELKLKVGVIYLEQPVVETARRIAGKAAGKILHVPRKATVEDRRAALAMISEGDNLHLYNSFGAADWDVVKAKIRYMVHGLGCKSIYLDHLTALAANEEDERRGLDQIMAELAALALELKIYLHFISHLTRPKDGPPHEEGGRVKQTQFRGSNAIGMWSHFMFGLERNTQGEDEESRMTTFRVIKDRNTGQATGKTITLGYDTDTGRLYDADGFVPEKEAEEAYGF
ncbi:Zinc-binding domain of primase-helicase [Caballeronia temeraria]|uniref:Zinc-binding domain of primase-helicase n=1 Tax=Caballeronia temeraria TaxID=1777137 RepID=A0A158DM92_9BURK|nr:toprim domain-containing protein [Caballeronia temeraria]SAK95761.1 Zinc-binding domain of primase-helicase [Caballeronia temeraria]